MPPANSSDPTRQSNVLSSVRRSLLSTSPTRIGLAPTLPIHSLRASAEPVYPERRAITLSGVPDASAGACWVTRQLTLVSEAGDSYLPRRWATGGTSSIHSRATYHGSRVPPADARSG